MLTASNSYLTLFKFLTFGAHILDYSTDIFVGEVGATVRCCKMGGKLCVQIESL